MFDLYIEEFTDQNFLEDLSERGRNRLFKNSLIEALRYWHRKILPKHFTVIGQQNYGNAFRPKKSGARLVDAGQFRDRVLGRQDIRGTFKGASVKYFFGAPQGNLKKTLKLKNVEYMKNTHIRSLDSKTRNWIFSTMKGKQITFEDARNKLVAKITRGVYSNWGYSKQLKKEMARGITAMNATDRNILRSYIQQFIVDNISMGRANFSIKKFGIQQPTGF